MPLVTDKTDNAYANRYRNQELLSALTRIDEPEISVLTQTYLDPNVVDDNNFFDIHLYQNATLYVSYQCEDKYFLLVTVNKARGLKDEEANKSAMTPGGRRERDHGLVYTAFKETEEETNLKLDTLCNLFPEAKIRYLKTVSIPTKRGYLKFNAQLHCYSIALGRITLSQAKVLQDEIKPGDDVEFAEFVDVTDIITRTTTFVSLTTMHQPILLLPAVKELIVEILTDQLSHQASELCLLAEVVYLVSELPKNVSLKSSVATSSTASTSSNSVITSDINFEVEQQKAEYLLDKIHMAYQNQQQAQVIRLIKTLLLMTSTATLEKITEAFSRKDQQRVKLAQCIGRTYFNLSLLDIQQVNNKHQPTSNESKSVQQQISRCDIDDSRRFQLAHQYIFDKPHKRYARALKSQICEQVKARLANLGFEKYASKLAI